MVRAGLEAEALPEMLAKAGLAAIMVMLEAGAALAQTAPPPPPPSASDPKTPVVTGVVVSAQRPAVKSSIDRTTYAVGDDPQSQTGTAADVLRGLPSVDVDVDGNPSLRGDSGVQILLNGRPSAMFSGADRGAILQMMGADAIDSVEVITNPSARFNPDGAAGIINIVTKTNYKPGATGVLRGSVGEEGRYNLGGNGSYGAGPINIHGGVSIRQDTRERESDNLRSNPDPATGQTVVSDQTSTTRTSRQFRSAYLGLDYDVSKTDALTLDLSYDDRGGPPRSVEHDLSTLPASDFVRIGGGDERGVDQDASARYTHTFDGEDHQFTLDVKWSRSDDWDRHDYGDVFTVPAGPDTADDQVFRSREMQRQLQAEYTTPLPGGAKLDAGYSLRRDDDLYFNGADTLDPISGAATPNLAQTNQFAFTQTIHALFATYQRPLGKLQVMTGLRLEQVFIDADQQTTGLVDHSGYLRAYPSLHLEYPLTKTQSLKASYSLRINRPGADDLNPFVVVQDAFNETAGNPRLTPQQTHALEATWQHTLTSATQSVTAYFRQTEDALTDVTRYVEPTVLLATKENLGRIRSVGFDLSANGKPSKTFSYTVNAYLFDNQVAASNLGFSGVKQGVGYSGKVSLNWRPFAKDLLQLSLNYNGERLTPQGYRLPNGGADIGYRHDLLDNLAAVFTVSDLFDSRGEKTVIDTATVHDLALRRSAGRIAYAGLTWRLGGAKKRPADERFSY
jgi:outer membrane receptor protein involved in Fe transport